ncbi:MAG: ribonuclease P protein component [Woeseiaceae bacterium]
MEQGKPRSTPSTACRRFGKKDRLLNAAAFGHVFKKANRSRDKWFTVLSRENSGGGARLGLAISKKRCRKATARNRIKRIVRESFRHHRADLGDLDVVVINQAATTTATSRQLFDSLAGHWGRCGPAADVPDGQD